MWSILRETVSRRPSALADMLIDNWLNMKKHRKNAG